LFTVIPDAVDFHWNSDKFDFENYRSREFGFAVPHNFEFDKGHIFCAVYDRKWIVQLAAVLGLVQTLAVCIILSSGAYFFQ
jgi:hypothetical protein